MPPRLPELEIKCVFPVAGVDEPPPPWLIRASEFHCTTAIVVTKELIMKNLADAEKKDCAERMAFQSNLTANVKAMLMEFAKTRRDLARIASEERKALRLEIRKQVADLRKPTINLQAATPRALAVKLPVAGSRIKLIGASLAVPQAKPDRVVFSVSPSAHAPKPITSVPPVPAKAGAPKVKAAESPDLVPKTKIVEPAVKIRPAKKEAQDGWLSESFGKTATKAKRKKKK